MENSMKVRVLSFAYNFGTIAVAGLATFFASDQFAGFVHQYLGATTTAGVVVMLLIQELVKYLRNKSVIAKSNRGGAALARSEEPVVLI